MIADAGLGGLVGLFNSGVGTGVETLAYAQSQEVQFTTTADVRFYRRTYDGRCTPGLG